MRLEKDATDRIDHIKTESGTDNRRGRNYEVAEELRNAINVSLAIGRPLLVSGDPGCGKTELGFAIARKLGIDRVHFFSAKSDSEAKALFYEYDALGRFRAAQSGAPPEALDPRLFITYRALGRAILDSHGAPAVKHLTTPAFAPAETPSRSVVIIDEIDKAPRDFSNDLLNEIDQLWFRVAELSPVLGEGKAETPRERPQPANSPIVVVTSNLERQLPDAFLRRCVFHHIEFPKKAETRDKIVLNHLGRMDRHISQAELAAAMGVVEWARGGGLARQPGLAEVIDFLSAVVATPGASLKLRMLECVSALAKETPDANALVKYISALPASGSK